MKGKEGGGGSHWLGTGTEGGGKKNGGISSAAKATRGGSGFKTVKQIAFKLPHFTTSSRVYPLLYRGRFCSRHLPVTRHRQRWVHTLPLCFTVVSHTHTRLESTPLRYQFPALLRRRHLSSKLRYATLHLHFCLREITSDQ